MSIALRLALAALLLIVLAGCAYLVVRGRGEPYVTCCRGDGWS